MRTEYTAFSDEIRCDGPTVGVAQSHSVFKRLVVAFGIDNAVLIACLRDALQNGCGARAFSLTFPAAHAAQAAG